MGETQTKYDFTFIYPQGHTVTRKLDADGRVGTMQTLHNLNEGLFSVKLSWLPSVLFNFIKLMYGVFSSDELASFERDWNGNVERHLPGWNDGTSSSRNAGTHWLISHN